MNEHEGKEEKVSLLSLLPLKENAKKETVAAAFNKTKSPDGGGGGRNVRAGWVQLRGEEKAFAPERKNEGTEFVAHLYQKAFNEMKPCWT